MQESLGFSPLELLFGRKVHGPLKFLKESWLEEDDQVSLLEQVSQLHHRMTSARDIARANLKIPRKEWKHGITEELERDSSKLGMKF